MVLKDKLRISPSVCLSISLSLSISIARSSGFLLVASRASSSSSASPSSSFVVVLRFLPFLFSGSVLVGIISFWKFWGGVCAGIGAPLKCPFGDSSGQGSREKPSLTKQGGFRVLGFRL